MMQGEPAAERLTLPPAPVPRVGSLVALAPWLLGAGLFIANNAAIIGGWLNAPAGYQPMFIQRVGDLAQYFTWIEGFRISTLIPNYHAPWLTEPAYFNFLAWLIAQFANLLGGRVLLAYHFTHLAGYMLAAHGFVLVLRVFTSTAAQARLALLVTLLAVPLLSLAVLPIALLRGLGLHFVPALPGMGDFMWWSSDGFFHGISGSIFVTYGTAFILWALGLLGLYLQTGQRRYFAGVCLVAFASGFLHPFEVVTIVGAGAGTLWLVQRTKSGKRGLLEAGALAAAGFAGLLPLTVSVLNVPWLRDAAAVNLWTPFNPLRLLSILGLPTILTLALLVKQPRTRTVTDALLRNWFLFTLIALYVPWIHWSQHLLDGFHYVTALLLVRLAAGNHPLAAVRKRYPRIATTGLGVVLLLSISAYVAYIRASYVAGAQPDQPRRISTVASNAEMQLLDQLRRTAEPEDLVLAPKQYAAWLATVPMHSFASHFVFSLTYEQQAALADDFYAGRMSGGDAQRFLAEYRPRYIVIPIESPARRYMGAASSQETIGPLMIYRFNRYRMPTYASRSTR